MLNAIFRPLEKWPGEPTPASERRPSPFFASYRDTLDLLAFELRKLSASNAVIQVRVPAARILNNGALHPQAVVNGPEVILSFHGDGHDYVYPCDTFNAWESNLRAIALALEALRKIDRYGVTRRGEQYQGFRALPPAAEARPKMSAIEAADFIASKLPGVAPGALSANRELFEAMFRLLQTQLHPDRLGATASHDDFVALQEAGAVLREYFNAQKAGAS